MVPHAFAVALFFLPFWKFQATLPLKLHRQGKLPRRMKQAPEPRKELEAKRIRQEKAAKRPQSDAITQLVLQRTIEEQIRDRAYEL